MPPHPMYPDMTDTNYYNGDVKSAHPSQAKTVQSDATST